MLNKGNRIIEKIIEAQHREASRGIILDGNLEKIREEISNQVKLDYSTIPAEEFNKKYGKYLNGTTFKARKTPKSAEEIAKEQEERELAVLTALKSRFPPDKRFFSWTNKEEEKWHRYESLPTIEVLEKKKAIRWTGGMMASATGMNNLGSFVIVGVHFDSRVIEFEYIYENNKLYSPNF